MPSFALPGNADQITRQTDANCLGPNVTVYDLASVHPQYHVNERVYCETKGGRSNVRPSPWTRGSRVARSMSISLFDNSARDSA